jgi:hypothetical protein
MEQVRVATVDATSMPRHADIRSEFDYRTGVMKCENYFVPTTLVAAQLLLPRVRLNAPGNV